MRIDPDFVKSERQKRGWSQEQLAALAGLGVRTIQRLESTGVASNESARSLASVFEVPLARIQVEKHPPITLRAKLAAAASLLTLILVSSILLIPTANASAVGLTVVVFSEVSGVSNLGLDLDDGQQTEIKLEKDLRLLVTPKLQKDGLVLVSIELYGWDGADYKLVSQPKVLMRDKARSRVQVKLPNGKIVSIEMTPERGGRGKA